jgi:hypothetical protein
LSGAACIGDELKNGGSSGGQAGAGGSGGSAGTGASGGSAGTGAGGAAGSGALGGSGGTGGTDAGSGGAAGGTFSVPTTDLVLWLDAEHISDGADASNLVSTWIDRSPLAKDAFQTVTGSQPIVTSVNGKPAVSFDGVDDSLDLPNGYGDFTNGLTVFAVASFDQNGSCASAPLVHLSNLGQGAQLVSLRRSKVGETLLSLGVQSAVSVAGSVPDGALRLLGARNYAPGTAQIYVNGVESGASAPVAFAENVVRTDNHIGKGEGPCLFHGVVQEILLYRRDIDSAERAQINQYLQTKWACCSG